MEIERANRFWSVWRTMDLRGKARLGLWPLVFENLVFAVSVCEQASRRYTCAQGD